MLRKPFLVLSLLFVAIDVASGQTPVRPDTAGSVQGNRSGAWSARTSAGQTLMGTWTAVPDPKTGSVIGTWALVDAQGNALAGGAWSASKALTQWTGNWRAVVTGRAGEFSGSWTSSTDLKSDASFGDLFEKAVEAVVSGVWRVGALSGAWSIRTAKIEGGT